MVNESVRSMLDVGKSVKERKRGVCACGGGRGERRRVKKCN